MAGNFMDDRDMGRDAGFVGEIGSTPVGFELYPRTQSGVGPCDSQLDPTERRIALPGVWATFAVNWRLNGANPATTLTLDTVQRQIGTCGISDAPNLADLGFSLAGQNLSEIQTSLAKDGFFYADYDFLFHSIGIQAHGPLFLSTLGAAGANSNTHTSTALWNGIVPFSDTIQQWLFSAFLGAFAVTFSVDSETKCDWLGLPMDIAGAGFGLDGSQAGSNGVAVRGNRADFRVNFRARGGSSNGRDTSKRLVTKFFRDSTATQPSLTLPAGLNINGLANGENLTGITQLIRVYYEGCPAPALGSSVGAAVGNQSAEIQQLKEMVMKLQGQQGAPANKSATGWYRY